MKLNRYLFEITFVGGAVVDKEVFAENLAAAWAEIVLHDRASVLQKCVLLEGDNFNE